jgi:uncharacterized protein (TIRG00374 family)
MKSKLNAQRIAIVVAILFVIAGVFIVVLDWNEIRRIAGQAKWYLLVPSLSFMAVSYICSSFSSSLVFRLFGIKLRFVDLLEISFVSNVVTYLMNVGGVTGISLEFVLMKKQGLATETILAPSIFQQYFNSLMLIALLPTGMFIVITDPAVAVSTRLGLSIAAAVLTFLLIVAGVIFAKAFIRAAIFRGLGRVTRFIIHRNIISALNDFDVALTRGVSLIRHRPKELSMLILLTLGDWASTVICLWFCFYALANPIGAGTLLTGFSLGIAAGFISLVPGGLGVQEGSMTGIYALLGVPVNTAFLAAILFRVIYYFVPFAVSLGFYRKLLRIPQ